MRISTSLALSASVATVFADIARPNAPQHENSYDEKDKHQQVVGLGNETWVYTREPQEDQFEFPNKTGKLLYHVIPNIRYAVAPLGDRRFAKPVSVGNVWSNNPQEDPNLRICYQAHATGRRPQTKANFDGSEDCLFLDVYTPNRGWGEDEDVKYPVTVFFHDGDFIAGSKNDVDYAGLMKDTMALSPAHNTGTVLVSFNYRLGLFGFLPQTSDKTDRVHNVGLWDQKFVLEWVQQHIHLFHGDPSQVTLVGEGTGATSIIHQLTSWSGKQHKPLFKRAVLHDPRLPHYTWDLAEQYMQQGGHFITGRLIDDVYDIANMSGEELQWLNQMMLDEDPLLFGPIRDDSIAHTHPLNILNHNHELQTNSDVEIMVGNNDHSDFSNDYGEIDFDTQFPFLAPEDRSKITDAFGSTDDRSADEIMHDALIGCTSQAIALANPAKVRKYVYNSTISGTRPGIHVWQVHAPEEAGAEVQVESHPNDRLLKFLANVDVGADWKPYGQGGTLYFTQSDDGPQHVSDIDPRCDILTKSMVAYQPEERERRKVFNAPKGYSRIHRVPDAASSLQGKTTGVVFAAALAMALVAL